MLPRAVYFCGYYFWSSTVWGFYNNKDLHIWFNKVQWKTKEIQYINLRTLFVDYQLKLMAVSSIKISPNSNKVIKPHPGVQNMDIKGTTKCLGFLYCFLEWNLASTGASCFIHMGITQNPFIPPPVFLASPCSWSHQTGWSSLKRQ